MKTISYFKVLPALLLIWLATEAAAVSMDDDPFGARTLIVDGAAINDAIGPVGDIDWYKFVAAENGQYVIETGGPTDMYMHLYDVDGSSLLDEENSGGADNNPKIIWDCEASGIYYIRLETDDPADTGDYSVSVVSNRDPLSRFNYTYTASGWSSAFSNILNSSDTTASIEFGFYDQNGALIEIDIVELESGYSRSTWDVFGGDLYDFDNPLVVKMRSDRNLGVDWGGWSPSAGSSSVVWSTAHAAGDQFVLPLRGWSNSEIIVTNTSAITVTINSTIYNANGSFVTNLPRTISGNGCAIIGDIYNYAAPAVVEVTSSGGDVVVQSRRWSASTAGWGCYHLPQARAAGTRFMFPAQGWSNSWFNIANAGDSQTGANIYVYDSNGVLRKSASTTVAANGFASTWDLIGDVYNYANPALVSIESDKDIVVDSGRWSSSSGWGFTVPPVDVCSGREFAYPVRGWGNSFSNIANVSSGEVLVDVKIYDLQRNLKKLGNAAIPAHGVLNTWDLFGDIYDWSAPAIVEITSDRSVVVDNGRWSSSSGWGFTVPPGFEDRDADGVPDDWEILNFGNTTSYGAYDDPDTDGLTNKAEYDYDTDPTDADSDGDGKNDGDELHVPLGSPFEPTDPHDTDTDDDGLNDGDEISAGTDPHDTDSDDDGLSDGSDTYPANPDYDQDGAGDGEEHAFGTDITSAYSRPYIYATAVKGWGNSFSTFVNTADTRIASGFVKVYDSSGVEKTSVPFNLNPGAQQNSWSLLGGDIYSYAAPAFIRILSTEKLYVDNGRWSTGAGWGLDVPEIGVAAGTEFVVPIRGWSNGWVNVSNPGFNDLICTRTIHNSAGVVQRSDVLNVPAHGVVSTWDDLPTPNLYNVAAPAVVRIVSDSNMLVEHGCWNSGAGWASNSLPVSEAAGTSFLFPVSGWSDSWMNIANTESSSDTLTVKIYDGSGTETLSAVINIAGNGFAGTWDAIGDIYNYANPAVVSIESNNSIVVTNGRWGNSAGWQFNVPRKDVCAGRQFTYTIRGWSNSFSNIANASTSTANVNLSIFDAAGVFTGVYYSGSIPVGGVVNTWNILGDLYDAVAPATIDITSDRNIIVDNGRWSNSSSYSGWGFTILPLD